MVVRIEIQRYYVGDVSKLRARKEGTEVYTFEQQPNENDDQFRWRIMDDLNDGVVFLFQKPIVLEHSAEV